MMQIQISWMHLSLLSWKSPNCTKYQIIPLGVTVEQATLKKWFGNIPITRSLPNFEETSFQSYIYPICVACSLNWYAWLIAHKKGWTTHY